MNTTPADEVLDKYKAELGCDLGEIFWALWKQLVEINHLWNEFHELFGNKEDVKLLNEIAPNHFNRIQNLFIDSILLRISKLVDNKENFQGHKNASIRHLVDHHNSQCLRDNIDTALKVSKKIQKIRHKRIAHDDLQVNLRKQTLPKITFEEIGNAVQSLNDVMNSISQDLRDTEIAFDVVICSGGAETFMHFLRHAKK